MSPSENRAYNQGLTDGDTLHPYGRVALSVCPDCRRYFEDRGFTRSDDWGYDEAVLHHAKHRLGLCCSGRK
jgi:hypothetical protein